MMEFEVLRKLQNSFAIKKAALSKISMKSEIRVLKNRTPAPVPVLTKADLRSLYNYADRMCLEAVKELISYEKSSEETNVKFPFRRTGNSARQSWYYYNCTIGNARGNRPDL